MRMASLLCFSLLAQDSTFRTTVPIVLLPVTVEDKKGKPVDGLEASDFQVLDNGKAVLPQLDTADVLTTPLSIVFAIQTNDIADPALLKIQKIGAMIAPLIAGERGRVAVLTYGEKVNVRQDFTTDAAAIEDVFKSLKSEPTSGAKLLDALEESMRLLRLQPSNARRIVIFIGESRDRGSDKKLNDALVDIQRQGLTVFSLVYSAYLTPFTTKASEYKQRAGGFDLLAALNGVARMGQTNTADVLASASGGRRQSFQTLHALEETLARLGEEIHSQYLLSIPASPDTGFHTLAVQIKSQPELTVRTRPGYWVDASPR